MRSVELCVGIYLRVGVCVCVRGEIAFLNEDRGFFFFI